MRNFNYSVLAALFMAIIFSACGAPAPETAEEKVEVTASTEGMPADFVATLDAHGGLDSWKEFRQLSYNMPKGEDNEFQLIDLYDRREYIKQPAAPGEDPIEMGFDGENVWVTADTTYKGNPAFYKNLRFYFYAMPWVLADPGIIYSEAEPLVFDGVTYPGIMISYDNGVGYSPKDNYRLHYDPETKKMRWLAYTVTGNSGKTSDTFKWLEYPTWSDFGGVELADSMVSYTTENNLPVTSRGPRYFNDVKLSKEAAPDSRFARPEGARIVE
ncbi:hypothetical protein FUA23_18075 [Neolewinella aurantiaca]|uniref:Lipoprotein n=1 Tax=Neolewinella aurantiaca TaxID=2602767 RepID=A0A5C7FDM8_9BACT|nr:DUF6503 family protein [Neolewinella aurantiaca]TXF87608.1 hypothetical protein FUA23_18075 [Neolewinella aurantiaca]